MAGDKCYFDSFPSANVQRFGGGQLGSLDFDLRTHSRRQIEAVQSPFQRVLENSAEQLPTAATANKLAIRETALFIPENDHLALV
jgi:hypothetical protein